jgi:hypothetical protein
MSPLDPLLMYMVFGLSDSTEQLIHHSPFGPVESGGEAGPGGRKSVRGGVKISRIRPGCDGGSTAEEIGGGGVKTGRIRPGIGRARDGGSAAQEFSGGGVKTGCIRSGISRLSR